DFVRLGIPYDSGKVGGVGEITVLQKKLNILFMTILVYMVKALGVERRGAPLDSVYVVAFFQQELRQIRAILAGDSRDKSHFSFCHDDYPFSVLVAGTLRA